MPPGERIIPALAMRVDGEDAVDCWMRMGGITGSAAIPVT